ncbi:MAG: response regulator [Bacteroidia bacterium]|nr:response regulator [Bacteroidia bacterium]
MTFNSNKPILLLEDDLVDVMTFKRAVRDLAVKNELIVKGNGVEGLEFLEKALEIPCMILLDLNMPKMNGLEFLEEIKKHPRFRHIPVIILTTSKEQTDRMQSFQLSVAGYMVKPVNYQNFINMLNTIHQYWSLSEYPE